MHNTIKRKLFQNDIENVVIPNVEKPNVLDAFPKPQRQWNEALTRNDTVVLEQHKQVGISQRGFGKKFVERKPITGVHHSGKKEAFQS